MTIAVAATVVLLDQVSKVWAVATLEGTAPRALVGELLKLHFVRNPGAAFSLGGSYTFIISALAIGVSVIILRTARTLTSTWWAVVLGGVLGGAVGNLLDRLFRAPGPLRGHVVDFLELPNWPIFNVADMALVGSAILAVGLSLRGVELTEPDPVPAAPEHSAAQPQSDERPQGRQPAGETAPGTDGAPGDRR